MALGAFASKTVACLLDSAQLNASYALGKATFGKVDTHNIANGLGQGNLWLFGDIAPAHWFYNHYPQHFFNGMDCINNRACEKLVEPVKSYVKALPWSAKSLSKINDLAASDDLKRGFEYVLQIEKMVPSTDRRKLQLKHLLAIADHEQRRILQKLIYNDPDFSKWAVNEREMKEQWIHLTKWELWQHWARTHWMAPKYELVFTHACSTDDPELKSIAPDDLIVENEDSRMHWIGKAAEQFHKLMNTKAEHMTKELTIMAGWKDSPDALLVY